MVFANFPANIFSFLFLRLLIGSSVAGNFKNFQKAYVDTSLYEKAIEKAKTNKRVIDRIGEIEPIDRLAILEGNEIYSNNNKSVEVSIRLKGNKGKGKIDIAPARNGTSWDYKKINIRIKEPKEVIEVLNDSI